MHVFLIECSNSEFPDVSGFADQRGNSSARAPGMCTHVQLHLHERCAHTPAAHLNGGCVYMQVRSPAISTARLQTPHGPLVGRSPQVGDPCSNSLLILNGIKDVDIYLFIYMSPISSSADPRWLTTK